MTTNVPYAARLVLVSVVCLAACVPTPETYSIPPQHKPVAGTEPIFSFGDYVRSTQADAESYYLKDIMGLEGGNFRWTHAEPELRFFLKSVRNRRFHMQIGINDVTFRDTGPVNIVILVNGQELDRVTYDRFGDKTYDKTVPARLLKINAENRVVIRVLNPWNSSDPKIKLGFVLMEAGFL
jgi:hypothetical protein